jgi:uncharacterized protein (TIGR00730 family)
MRRRANSHDCARSIRRIRTTANIVVVTGGGPGVMEAGNRGAADVGAPSIGLNIVLPHEQAPNLYVTPELCFNFHYFAIRKMHFIMRAKAVAVFPGGFGTMDELFETLTLIQTGRMERVPVLLFGKAFWDKAIDLDFLADQGTISPGDQHIINAVDTAQEAWDIISGFMWPSPTGAGKPTGSSTPPRPRAARTEIHSMEIVDDVMAMRPVEGGLEIPAGRDAHASNPAATIVMFIGVADAFVEGEIVPVTLEFEDAGRVELEFEVRGMAHGRSAAHGPGHGQNGGHQGAQRRGHDQDDGEGHTHSH